MSLFTRKQVLGETGIYNGYVDWHSHILPGVDDGLQKVEDSLAILDVYASLGVREVWLTPHIMEDVPNETAALRGRFAWFSAQYSGPIALHLAAENMIDNLFCERLDAGDLLPLGSKGDCLLVETSYMSPPLGFHSTLRKIQSKGFHPVLAHPERYVYMSERDYKELKDMGVRLQLNIPSLFGAYGSEAQTKARHLLRQGLYTLSGHDLHSLHFLRHLLDQKLPAKDLALLWQLLSRQGTI